VNAEGLLDPSYSFFLDEPSSEWTLDTLPGIRERIHNGYPSAQAARCEEAWTSADAKRPAVRLCLYRPGFSVADGQMLPAILYLHGGGFVLGRPEMADDYLANLATELNTVVVAPDYRLAPEHPFPTPLEDCYTALDWLVRQARALGVDAKKIAILGHSAGGGLAASLALLVRDREEYQIAGLVMIYPMLDHRTGTSAAPSDNPTTGLLSWSQEANHFCWQCMQGSYEVEEERAYLFSPAMAPHLQGLPATFIGVGALDLFLDENVAFGLKLSRSGIATQMHVYPGVPHMFDQYPGEVTDQCKHDVERALARLLL
jgi:acetyl esterase/lipase